MRTPFEPGNPGNGRSVPDPGQALGWWQHFMAAGAMTLLYNVAWLNVAGGLAFGVGFAWWLVGRAYGYDLRTWWEA
ncbi:MAG: hypothetical protein WD473_11730 [Acidimicrobiia bacterium]